MHSLSTSPVVLIVEDHPANLLLTRIVLERAGFQALEARSADDARRQLRQVTPHVILMDIGLPGQDGLSLTRELKSTTQTSAIPVVVLTARAMPRDREQALAAGCDAYVSKPFEAQHLVRVITDVLRAVDPSEPQTMIADRKSVREGRGGGTAAPASCAGRERDQSSNA